MSFHDEEVPVPPADPVVLVVLDSLTGLEVQNETYDTTLDISGTGDPGSRIDIWSSSVEFQGGAPRGFLLLRHARRFGVSGR